MKKLISLIVLLNVLLFPQATKEEKLEWMKSRGDIKVTEEGNDIYKIEYPEGRSQYYFFGNTENYQTDSIPTTVIETWNIDTNLYKDKYYFWQEIPPVTVSNYELVIGDINNNGYTEIYGFTRDYEDLWPKPVQIFEIDSMGIFSNKFTYPDSVIHAYAIYDIDFNSSKELYLYMNNWRSIFYEPESPDSLPTDVDLVFSLYDGQLDNPQFGDFDKNNITDFLFYQLSDRRTVICEYDSVMNNFLSIAEIQDSIGYYAGYAIGDFDMDNKTDIVYGSLDGEVFVVENQSEHIYLKVWTKDIDGYHSYMQIATNDIDKNGKPEFWVSSTTYNGFTDVTNFTCFEYTSDNEYAETYRIEFVGVFPIYAANAFSRDVNNDGTEELVMCISNYIFIMQFKGSSVNPSYKIFYMTRNNIPGGFFSVTMYDLDKDGYEELLINRDVMRSDGKSKRCTHIFKPDFVVDINNKTDSQVFDFSLEQNYPNPFNPVTTISYSLPQRTYFSLKVYDMLGNEIAVLDEGEKNKGSYIVQWNGKDKFQNSVSSGIYFINLATPEFNKTIKGVMLK